MRNRLVVQFVIPTTAESITSKVKRKKSFAEYEIGSGKFCMMRNRAVCFERAVLIFFFFSVSLTFLSPKSTFYSVQLCLVSEIEMKLIDLIFPSGFIYVCF